MTGPATWAQPVCEGPDPPECEIDCDSDDWDPYALPGGAGCEEEIPPPPAPPCETDRFFVEPGLVDCDGWGNPLEPTVNVSRYVGPTNTFGGEPPDPPTHSRLIDWEDYVDKGRLGEYATLSIMAYDVDRKASACWPATVNKVKFNTIPVGNMHAKNGNGALRGGNQAWAVTNFKIPIRYVNFPSDPGSGSSPPGAWANYVSIDVPDPCRCIAIGWITLEIDAASPVVMVHGMGADHEFWDHPLVTIDDKLSEERFVVDTTVNYNPEPDPEVTDYTIRTGSELLHGQLKDISTRYGSDTLHLVAHSKGGLVSIRMMAREYQRTDSFRVISLTTLGSPLKGSVLADMAEARKKALLPVFLGFPWGTQTMFTFVSIFVPGTSVLTTWFVSDLMEQCVPNLTWGALYQTVGADLDLSNNGHVSCTPDEAETVREFFTPLEALGCGGARPLLNVLYRNVRLKRTVQFVSVIGIGVAIVGVDAGSPQGNDILVSINSAKGPTAYRSRVSEEIVYDYPSGKTHSSIADAEVGEDIIPVLVQADVLYHYNWHVTCSD